MKGAFIALCALVLAAAALSWARPALPAPAPTPAPTGTTPTPTPSTEAAAPAGPKKSATFIFGGDVMLGRTVQTRMNEYGAIWLTADIARQASAADFTVFNLESPLRANAQQTPIGSLVLRGDPAGLPALTSAGTDLVSLANNHIPDMGAEGMAETKRLLGGAGISYAGAGTTRAEAEAPTVVERNGFKTGFLSVSYGVNFETTGVEAARADAVRVAARIKLLKPEVDAVVVLCHCGVEHRAEPTEAQRTFFHAAIDAGADLVIGHHPHVAEPAERYGGGLAVYSLGNLVFDQLPGEWRDRSALARITLGSERKLELLPYRIVRLARPEFLVSEPEKAAVWDRFQVPGGTFRF